MRGKTLASRCVLLGLLWASLIALIAVSHDGLFKRGIAPVGLAEGTTSWLPRPQVVKLVSMGHERFLADMFWLSFVQYFGSPKQTASGQYPLAYAYFDLLSQLDPRFEKPYWFAAFTLGYHCKRPDQADEILRRGTEVMPDRWYMWFIRGINMYLFAHRDRVAAQYYRQAGSLPGAPPYLKRQGEMMDAGITEAEREVRGWRSMYYAAHNEQERALARNRLVEIYRAIYRKSPSAELKEAIRRQVRYLDLDPRILD
jgi:hypothetical protein